MYLCFEQDYYVLTALYSRIKELRFSGILETW